MASITDANVLLLPSLSFLQAPRSVKTWATARRILGRQKKLGPLAFRPLDERGLHHTVRSRHSRYGEEYLGDEIPTPYGDDARTLKHLTGRGPLPWDFARVIRSAKGRSKG